MYICNFIVHNINYYKLYNHIRSDAHTLYATQILSVIKMHLSKFVVLLLVAAVAAQNDCPNSATECPDSCAGEQCARFLNAECQENPCHGLCTPNFFWRGKNVTNRCPVERCRDKVCPGIRECVEMVRPTSCPEGVPQSLCRQYIRATCVLPPPPTNCSQITCGEGMFCRERHRGGEGVTCVRARNCNQLTCDEGSICSETEEGPKCVISIQLSCKDLKCPEGTICVADSIPSRNLSVAQCVNQEETERLPRFETFFCGSGALICHNEPQAEACIDFYESGNYLTPTCLESSCDPESPNSSCMLGSRLCAMTPNYLNAPFTSICVGSTSIVSNSSRCDSAPADRCPGNFVCREAFYDGKFFFSTCGFPAPAFAAPSCAELECPVPLECNELGQVEGRGGIARCGGPEFTGETENFIRSLLDKIQKYS